MEAPAARANVSKAAGRFSRSRPTGKLTTLYNFCSLTSNCTDGAVPFGPLVQGTDGMFYGTTSGDFDDELESYGTVFEISRQWRPHHASHLLLLAWLCRR